METEELQRSELLMHEAELAWRGDQLRGCSDDNLEERWMRLRVKFLENRVKDLNKVLIKAEEFRKWEKKVEAGQRPIRCGTGFINHGEM